MTTEERKQQLVLYARAHDLLLEALNKFPKEMWTYKPSEKQWSIHEIIIHITDSEVNSYVRCRRFIAEPGKMVLGYDQDLWAEKLSYHVRSTDDALGLFKLLRQSSFEIIKDLPSETWQNTVNHSENGIMTMDEWLIAYADHIPGHINQMGKVYASWQGKNK